ncbi:BadM/Rrf2 family transcriptional regulator [Desulfitobacterium sp. LBE]|uniref:Rrf2 family transcriptional regulator n=5 Tax=root TaxID=1 RepID=Q24US6_DESHY|nr:MULTISPECIES: Rrf2 family transcriptional regulator [Desulfitobacterium]ACL21599.1 transcriptional regulator, BadM/Rrf2 family [Desulfitobacterium hafniense DCB-2]KTE89743.1 Rrf2 family transcriptional regulator [Desulfitobacterium hafniense]MEA5023281.1 Rrf2 family transcriptional regulator [Desulfitobacterium hafniense]TWH60620.1 BadM/Rrf2 family transcriptional regulator [Desulfitobacterium sp. LBE]CDX02513.1 HTH-type transcriptional regulator CymR [Desulfitobacterium hafniense]
MKLSTKGRYGLTAMVDLALNSGEGPISLKSIADRQGLSEHYLEQLISGLRKAGLVKSIRGAQGGYVLGKKAEKIRIGDIIRVLEGPIAPVECEANGDPECCQKSDYCVTRSIREKVRDPIEDVLDSISLADLVRDPQTMCTIADPG